MIDGVLRFLSENGWLVKVLALPALVPLGVILLTIPLQLLLALRSGPWPVTVRQWLADRLRSPGPVLRVLAVENDSSAAGRYHRSERAVAVRVDRAGRRDASAIEEAARLAAQVRLGRVAPVFFLPKWLAAQLAPLRLMLLLCNFYYGSKLVTELARWVLSAELAVLAVGVVARLVLAGSSVVAIQGGPHGTPRQRRAVSLLALVEALFPAGLLAGVWLLFQRFDEVARLIESRAHFVPAPPLAGAGAVLAQLLFFTVALFLLWQPVRAVRALRSTQTPGTPLTRLRRLGSPLLWELPLALLMWLLRAQPYGPGLAPALIIATGALSHVLALALVVLSFLGLALLTLVVAVVLPKRRRRADTPDEPEPQPDPPEPWMDAPTVAEQLVGLRLLYAVPLLVLLAQTWLR